MTRFVFAADAHVGNHKQHGGVYEAGLNVRARYCLDTFAELFRVAADERADGLVFVGDVFDDDRPSPQLVAAVQRIYKGGGDFVWTVPGNHDLTSNAEGHHALAPLAPVTRIYTKPQIVCRGREDRVEVGLLPFRSDPARDYIPADARSLPWSARKGRRLLGIHAGVIDPSTPAWLRVQPDGIPYEDLLALGDELGIDAIFAGHWHGARTLNGARVDPGPVIVQVGSLCPTGFDDTSLFHGAWIWDDGKITNREIAGPRFAKVRSEDELEEVVAWGRKTKARLFVSWEADPDAMATATATLQDAMPSDVLVGWAVVPNGAAVEAVARSAADAAKNATAFDEALAAFVDKVGIADGVDRERVLAMSKHYLGA